MRVRLREAGGRARYCDDEQSRGHDAALAEAVHEAPASGDVTNLTSAKTEMTALASRADTSKVPGRTLAGQPGPGCRKPRATQNATADRTATSRGRPSRRGAATNGPAQALGPAHRGRCRVGRGLRVTGALYPPRRRTPKRKRGAVDDRTSPRYASGGGVRGRRNRLACPGLDLGASSTSSGRGPTMPAQRRSATSPPCGGTSTGCWRPTS